MLDVEEKKDGGEHNPNDRTDGERQVDAQFDMRVLGDRHGPIHGGAAALFPSDGLPPLQV